MSTTATSMGGRRRIPARNLPAASLGASLAIHGALLMLGAIVVYQAAHLQTTPQRDVTVNFDAPGQSETAPAQSAFGRARGEVALVTTESNMSNSSLPAPVAAPSLTGLSSRMANAAQAQSESPMARSSGSADLDHLFADSDKGAAATEGVVGGEAVTFAGLGASTARSVVYAVDCSGPMVTSLPIVLAEVRRSVSRLSPTQKFGVILFRRNGDTPVIEAFAPVLVRATPTALDRLSEWLINAEPSGRSCPLAGLESALALHPDAVFLLSRSIDRSGGGVWDGGLTATMARLDELNPKDVSGHRAVVIQTIQFLDEDPTGTLQAVGTQHGTGKTGYRVIKRSEDLSSR